MGLGDVEVGLEVEAVVEVDLVALLGVVERRVCRRARAWDGVRV